MNSDGKEKRKIDINGHKLPAEEGRRKALIDFLKQSLEKECFDSILIPIEVPETNSYALILLKDESLLDKADPQPPVMTVQGGTALSSVTKHGEIDGEIAAVLRPCEIRAAVELAKLKQINLDNITLISMDCPGAVPLSDYMIDPEKWGNAFQSISEKWEINDSLRPVCRICNRFSLENLHPSSSPESFASDLHLGFAGGEGKNIFIIPATPKGKNLLAKLDLSAQDSLEDWESKVNEIRELREREREKFQKEWRTKLDGADSFISQFDECINCHNCMRTCPICYCQQCYFDSQILKLSPEDYLDRAKKRGALRFPLDTILFHLGRMSHMALSCISCGACEDACPMSIPVSQIFTMVGDKTQKDFHYIPGINRKEPLPLQDYVEDEFHEVETPHKDEEMPAVEVEKNV
jgi:formate dehydrogenase subunit beta